MNTETLSTYIIEHLVLGNKSFGIHHFTDGQAITWYGFAQRFLRDNEFVDSVKLERVRNYNSLASRPRNSVLN